jgi:DNA-binding IclR family transcriptional regulator
LFPDLARRRHRRELSMAAGDKDDVGGVQSIVRAFAILELVARAPDGISLSELSRAVRLHSSTTFNLVRTMFNLGYLRQSGDDKRYRIGRPLFSLAANAIDDLLLVDTAKAVMEDLSHASGETGTFAVWSGGQVVAMARSSGAGAFQLSDRVGGVRPAHATATGKVLLAALPPEQFDAYLASATLTRFTATTIVDAQRLRTEVQRTKTAGFAIDRAEFHDDVCCIAMPVRDFSGKTVGAIGLSAPLWRMGDDVRPAKAALLREAAHRLSEKLGHGGLSTAYSPAMARIERIAAPADAVRISAASPVKPRPAKRITTKSGAKTARARQRSSAAK